MHNKITQFLRKDFFLFLLLRVQKVMKRGCDKLNKLQGKDNKYENNTRELKFDNVLEKDPTKIVNT